MMHTGLYKFGKTKKIRKNKKFLRAFYAVTFMIVVIFFGYKFMENDVVPNQTFGLRSAAPENVTAQAQNFSANIQTEKFGGYAYRGQKDIGMMRFSLGILRAANGLAGKANQPKIKKMTFTVGGYSGTADLSSLQLYLDKKMIAQTPFVDGKAVFDNLAIQFDGETRLNFEVKANAGDSAAAGNRVQIAIAAPTDILIEDGELNRYSVAGDFPVESGYFSIVGSRIK
jgi:hypothetical protein